MSAQQASRSVTFLTSYVPLILATTALSEVARLQVERDLERGDVDSALRMINLTLRLSRDMRARAPMVMQNVASRLEVHVIEDMLRPLLKFPRLRTNHCDALLQLLVRHTTAVGSLDPFINGLRGDYLAKRMLLHNLEHQTAEFAEARLHEAFGIPHDSRAAVLLTPLNGTPKHWEALRAEPPPPYVSYILTPIVSTMTAANYEAEVAVLRERYEVLSAAATQSFAAREEAFASLREKYSGPANALFHSLPALPGPNTPLEELEEWVAEAVSTVEKLRAGDLQAPFWAAFFLNGAHLEQLMMFRSLAAQEVIPMTRLEGGKSLVALRRWFLTHTTPPPDMATLCREAGLTELPRDYFNDGPLRLITFIDETPIGHPRKKDLKAAAGETIIYSVGRDGIDHQALKDWDYGRTGDWLFRLDIPPNMISGTQQ